MPLGFTQAEADAQAFAVACKKAQANKVCFSNDATLNSACVGVFYSVGTFVSSPHPPFTFAVTSGTLPPGLVFDAVGVLSGTPTTAGTYNFSVTATDAIGSYQTKPFTLKVVGITSPATLTAATLNSAYTYSLAATGTTFPIVWSVNPLSLPTGLTMNSAGVISGTPTVAGTYNFTATVLDFAGASCSKDFTLVVSAGVGLLAYWPFESKNGDLFDDVTGHNYPLHGATGFQITVIPGKVNNGISNLASSELSFLAGEITNDDFDNPGTHGVTVCGWVYIDPMLIGNNTGVVFEIQYWDGTLGGANFTLFLSANSGALSFANSSDLSISADCPADLTGDWHFYRAWLDPVDTKLKLQIDDGTIFESPTTTWPNAPIYDFRTSTSSLSAYFDEMGYWKRPLSNAEGTQLWNGGAGTTYPAVPL